VDSKDLQGLLDSLDEGPLGKPEVYWDNLNKLGIAREVRYSKPVPKETRDKMSKAAKGRVNKASIDPRVRAKAAKTKSKGVRVYTYPDRKFIGEYMNTRTAGEALDMHPAIIVGICNGRHKQCRGYTFEYIKK
jgi:hypothetical protein